MILKSNIIGYRQGHFLTLATILLWFLPLWSQNSVHLPTDLLPLNLKTNTVQHFEDPRHLLTIEDVATRKLHRPIASGLPTMLNFGFSRSTHWVSFHLKNTQNQEVWHYLEIPYPLLDSVTLFTADTNGAWSYYSIGNAITFNQRQIPNRKLVFQLHHLPLQEKTYFLRVRSESAVVVPLIVYTQSGFTRQDNLELLLHGVLLGILVIMILYNGIVFLASRDTNYGFLVLFIASFLFYISAETGIAFQYLWPHSPWWAQRSVPTAVGLVIWTSVQFVQRFLRVGIFLPSLHKILRGFAWLGILCIVIALTPLYRQGVFFGAAVIVFYASTLFLTGILRLQQGSRSAKFFLVAWTVLLIGSIAYGLKAFGWLPETFFTKYGVPLGACIQIVLLSLGLVDVINTMKNQLKALNTLLDAKVRERTTELQKAVVRLEDTNAIIARQVEEITALSRTDTLTELANRRHFLEVLSIEITRCKRARHRLAKAEQNPASPTHAFGLLSLVMIDVDNFKRINDQYGHQAGDRVLREVATIFHQERKNNPSLLRKSDFAARYGGEEFILMLPETSAQGAVITAERLRAAMESHLFNVGPDTSIGVTISCGITELHLDTDENIDQIMQRADRALYRAKQEGRNRCCLS